MVGCRKVIGDVAAPYPGMRVEISFYYITPWLTMHSINIQMRGLYIWSKLRALEAITSSQLWLANAKRTSESNPNAILTMGFDSSDQPGPHVGSNRTRH
jgi:hypothetical protein